MKRDIDQQKMDHAGHTVHEEYEKYADTSSQGCDATGNNSLRCDATGTSTHECAGDREYYRSLAQQHWDSLGKPIDSLGVLEQHVTKLCMIERTTQPHIGRRALAVLCADHGCVREGVTQTTKSGPPAHHRFPLLPGQCLHQRSFRQGIWAARATLPDLRCLK